MRVGVRAFLLFGDHTVDANTFKKELDGQKHNQDPGFGISEMPCRWESSERGSVAVEAGQGADQLPNEGTARRYIRKGDDDSFIYFIDPNQAHLITRTRRRMKILENVFFNIGIIFSYASAACCCVPLASELVLRKYHEGDIMLVHNNPAAARAQSASTMI